MTAFDQLRPKFDQIYKEHQTEAQNGSSDAAGQTSDPESMQLGGVFPEILAEQLPSQLAETESLIAQLEEAQFPTASILRKSFDVVQDLAAKKQIKDALAGHNRLRPKVDAEFEKLSRGRSHGVMLPDELKNMAAGKAGDQAAQPAANGNSGATKAGPSATPSKSPAGFIAAAVGKGGKNNLDDVKAVQEALNQRGGAKLNPDGKFGPKTLKAIEEFQRKLGQFKPDGVIQPGRGLRGALSGAAQIPPTPAEPKPIAPPKQVRPLWIRGD